MLRSLISLLLIAGLNTPMVSNLEIPNSFDEFDLLEVESIPSKVTDTIAPVVEAKAALLMDVDTGLILYKKNSNERLPMASLTKIMTAILILESHKLNEVVTVTENYNPLKEDDIGARIWLKQYEKMTIENLLIALLVPSAGDTALALATYHSGSVGAFVDEMNQKAKQLNLKNTHFENPIGLDHPNHYSDAFDLAILTKYALSDRTFRRIIRIPRAVITSTNGQIIHDFEGTNYLLESYLNIQGVKTGTTDEAGASLINLARHTNGKEVITVLLNSPERFQESKRMIDWAFRNFKW